MENSFPPGISTALVHLDAPVSFIGKVGRIHATVTSNVPLVWAETGTPLGNFIDNISLDPGVPLEIQLPHTDQPGFLDASGDSIIGWYYRIEITYDLDGQTIPFPARDFQIVGAQDNVDLALIPAGEATDPVTAPTGYVMDIGGFTGSVTLEELQLHLVDNTRDLDKPVSRATATAIAEVSSAVTAANQRIDSLDTGKAPAAHTHTAAQISDATAVGRTVLKAADAAAARTAIGAGTSSLALGTTSATAKRGDWVPSYSEVTGMVPTSALPPLAVVETTPVASETEMLALDAQRGDIAIRSDVNKTFILAAEPASTLANWKEIMAAGQVLSVAGKTGTVTLAKADVGLGNVDNTSDANKPISTAAQTALNAKAPLASPAFTGTPTGITKAHVGLGNVDNTSDVNKPVSNAVKADYVPKWKTGTTYALGDQVISPYNEVVSAVAAHTSPLNYDPTKWRSTLEIPFGHMGRAQGFQSGTSATVETQVVTAAQKLKGGMMFDAQTWSLVIPRDGLYLVRVRAYFSGGTSDVCLMKPRFRMPAGVPDPAEVSGNWLSLPKGTGLADIHFSVEREIPLVAGTKIEHWFLSNLSVWGTDGYNGTWLEARYIGPIP